MSSETRDKILRQLFTLDNLFWLLLIALAALVITSMESLIKGLDFTLLISTMLGGLVLGWILAKIRAPWWLAVTIMIGSGFTLVLLLVGHLFSPILTMTQASIVYLFTLWQKQTLPDTYPIQLAGQGVIEGSIVVVSRLWNFFTTIGEKGAPDPLPIQLVWGWSLWVATAWGAYITWQNKQTIVAVIPWGILLTVAMFFTGIRSNTLLAFLFLTLVLQGMSSWKRRRHRWEDNQKDWATDIAQDVAVAASIIIAVSILLSATIPEISLSEIIKRFQFQQYLAQTSGQRVDDMVASLGINARPAPLPTPYQSTLGLAGGLPLQHTLGAGKLLSKEVVMLVSLSEPPPPHPQEIAYGQVESSTAFYWLATTFDKYSRRGWSNSRTTVEELDANQPQLEAIGPGRTTTQTVRLIEPFGNFLFTTGFPLNLNQPSQINFRTNKDWVGTALKTNAPYTAQSWLPQATPTELRNAGTDYPGWITKRYLQLPEELPNRVRTLALELTATAATPYDRAIAIETYLRAYPYTLDIPKPPAGQDVVEYFLFDLQEGYCDYYASSMAVLARAAGLPARFVVGYAPSPFDHRTGQYVVRESEAHSWVQIYFPEYGWIDFEPTGGRSALDREEEGGSKIAAVPTLPPDYDIEAALAAQLPWWEAVPLWKIFLVILAGAGALLLIAFSVMWFRDLRLGRLPASKLIPILEGRLERNARLLGVSPTGGTTALEFRTDLVNHLAYLVEKQSGLQQLVPKSDDVAQLVNGFIELRYSPHQISNDQGKAYLNTWRQLRWQFWTTIIAKKLRRIS